MSRIGKSTDTFQGKERMGKDPIGYKISFWSDKNVLELDKGDGCTIKKTKND